MTCRNVFEASSRQNIRPTQIVPLCHPKAAVDVFADHKRREITLVCSKCDQTISVIKVKKDPK